MIFSHTGIRNIVNMGFGDLMPDGSIDDKANSNNGDIVRVLTTTIQILIDFASRFPDAEIFFTGSTQERTKLYTRILRTYYEAFSKEFVIKVLMQEDQDFTEIPYEPKAHIKFYGFLIKRIR